MLLEGLIVLYFIKIYSKGRQLQLSDNCYKPQVNPLLIKWNAKGILEWLFIYIVIDLIVNNTEQKLQQLITVVTQFQYSVNWSRKGIQKLE